MASPSDYTAFAKSLERFRSTDLDVRNVDDDLGPSLRVAERHARLLAQIEQYKPSFDEVIAMCERPKEECDGAVLKRRVYGLLREFKALLEQP